MGRSLARSDIVNTHYRTPTFRAFLTSARCTVRHAQNHAISRGTALLAAAGSRAHGTRRIPTCAARDARTERAASHPCPPAQSRKRSTQSWRKWRRRQRDGGSSESRSKRRPGRGYCRRSECKMEVGARQPSPQRRAARFDRAAPPARSVVNCQPDVCAGRTGRHQRVVESVREGRWGGEVRSAAT